MASKKNKKSQYQPNIGVRTDFEKLLQRFSALNTVRYEKFAEVFRDMKLSLYCAGRQNQREAREFVEECFDLAVQFWLPPSSFLVRVGALYLLYGLYFFQLVSPRAKIRVTQEQWKTITEFHREAREQQHLDLEYIFQKLQVHKAFHFVFTSRELYPTFRNKESDKDHNPIPDNLKEEKSVVEEIFSNSAINQLELVHDQYQMMKVALNGEGATKPDPSLDVIHGDLITALNKTLQTHRSRQISAKYLREVADDVNDFEETLQEQSLTSVQKSLKKKAFTTSLGYFKSRRKGQDTSQSEDNTDSAAEADTKSPKLHRSVFGRGRQKIGDLYEQDEIDTGPVQPELLGVLNMPDIDSIIPAQFREPEENADDAKDSPPKLTKNQAKVKAKMKQELQKRQSAAKLKNSTGDTTDEASTGKGKKRKQTKSTSDTDPCSSPKVIKNEASETKSVIKGEPSDKAVKNISKSPKQRVGTKKSPLNKIRDKALKKKVHSEKSPSKKVKSGKPLSKKAESDKTIKKGGSVKKTKKMGEPKTKAGKAEANEGNVETSSPKKKVPSAQQILLQTLSKRKKEKRESKKK